MASSKSENKGAPITQKNVSQLGFKPSKAYQKELTSLLLIAGCVFYLLSILSFSPFDPSFYSINVPYKRTHNLAGVFGSYIAGFGIYYFGACALLLILPPSFFAYERLMRVRHKRLVIYILQWTIFFVSLTSLLSSYVPTINFRDVSFPTGGAIGREISSIAKGLLGSVGHDLIFLTMLFCAIVGITEKPLTSLAVKFFRRQMINALKISNQAFAKLTTKRPSKGPIGKANGQKNLFVKIEPKTVKDKIEPEIYVEKSVILNSKTSETDKQIEKLSTQEENPEYALEKIQYAPPSASIFKSSEHMPELSQKAYKEFEQTSIQLVRAFEEFGIQGEVIAIKPGPVVTVYEFQPKAGTKQSKLTALIDDIALALKVDSIFIHPVSGKRALGVQVPNQSRQVVFMGDILSSPEFIDSPSPLTFAMGKSLNGKPVCENLASMPHLLTAGQTGSGKSVAINTLLCSILMKASPGEVKLILVDPKILELKMYEGIPHLLMPVITEASKASLALKWACHEMDRRYQLMELAKVRNVDGFNQFWKQASTSEKHELIEQSELSDVDTLPLIVIVIDELADLMLTAPKDVEGSIQRLAQKARASGIHLVLATQRPSVDVITGVIKANLPCRCSFKVFSRGDSRTILDSIGAERLLGKGDMLFLKPGSARLQRIQGAFLDDNEVNNLVSNIRANSSPEYNEEAISWIESEYDKSKHGNKSGDKELIDAEMDDPKWDEALHIAQSQGHISASYLQRSLKIGYNRAARLVETMEKNGLVSKANGVKSRKWVGPTSNE